MFNLFSDPKDFLLLLTTALITTALVVSFFVLKRQRRKKVLALRRQLRQQQMQSSGAHLPTSQHPQNIVRASDLIRLTRDDEIRRQNALRLIEGGSVREGARILEELGLHRQAISALEQNHLIDDACGVLMHMNRPNRAGVVYQRNNLYIKAAECFLIANLPEEAARCYMDAGSANSEEYLHASHLYESLGKIPEALEALKRGSFTENFVAVALRHESYNFLRDCMNSEQATRSVFAYLDAFATKKLIKSLPLDTQTVEHFAIWCQTLHRTELLEQCLKRIYLQLPLLILFWKLVSDEFAHQHAHIMNLNSFNQNELTGFQRQNAKALFLAEKYECALQECIRLDLGLERLQCLIAMGRLEQAAQLVESHAAYGHLKPSFFELLYSLHPKDTPLDEATHACRAKLVDFLATHISEDTQLPSQPPLSLSA